jgi:hypothetical protein
LYYLQRLHDIYLHSVARVPQQLLYQLHMLFGLRMTGYPVGRRQTSHQLYYLLRQKQFYQY